MCINNGWSWGGSHVERMRLCKNREDAGGGVNKEFNDSCQGAIPV